MRFIAGSSLRSSVPILPPTFELVVSTSGDSAVTVTASCSGPSLSVAVIVTVWPIGTIRPVRENVLKLASFATTP